MIHAVRANKASFRTVEFTTGFNVVLADRTKESARKDSRNGLGKTTLFEIIHFCLGAATRPNKGLRVKDLSGWVFSLELSLGDRRILVHRGVDEFGKINIEGNTEGWGDERRGGRLVLSEREWTSLLGQEMFGLPEGQREEFGPTFRSVLGYFIRRGHDAFSTPFEHHRKQKEWDKQVNCAYLLGLAWEDAQAWQQLREKGEVLTALKRAVTSGVVEGMVGKVGELEAEKVLLEEATRKQTEELRSFQVHPQYREIEQQASALTGDIHELSNQNVADRRLLAYYESSLAEVGEAETESVARLYEEAGVALGGTVVRRLEEVQEFHHLLIGNRRRFLATEISRLQAEIATREDRIRELTGQRAKLLVILHEHGALDEYTRLQQRHIESQAALSNVETRLSNLRKFEAGRSALKIDQEHLHQKARQDYDERRAIRERAISLFNAHSEALYQAPGRLVLDVGPKGFTFDVEIQRSGSQGIDSMKVFCYDLMLARLWAARIPSPGFLLHDSTLFADVDERQFALALQLAEQVSREEGFQYICALNSDKLPKEEFRASFDTEEWVRLRLTDDRPEGSLLGFRF